MLYRKIILSFLFGLSAITFAQDSESFIKGYGNTGYDYGRDIKQDNDSGYVVTGSSSSFGPDNGEAYLLKLDKYGDFSWSRNYGGPGSEWGQALTVTNDSTYAIAGYTNSFGAGGFDFYLVRIDAEGNPLWEKTYGGSNWDQAFGMVQLPDSGFVIAGESYSFNDGIRHGYIVRTDKDGEQIWDISITEDEPSFFTDITLDGDSIVVCGGIGDGGEDTHDGFIVKYHIDGTYGWEKRIGEEYDDYFNAIYSVAGIYSLGGSRGYFYPDEKENMWMYRLEDNGTEIVDTVYSSESLESDMINDIVARDFDQDYYFVGQTASWGYQLDGEPDIFMGKMTLTGIQFAANNYGAEGADIGQAIDHTRDGGVVFLGDTRYFATGGHNIIIIKLNPFWDYPEIDVNEDGVNAIAYDDITTGILTTDVEMLSVYPNPFTDIITLPINEGVYRIYSPDGQLLLENELNTNQIYAGNLATGIYLLTLKTSEGFYQTRIIKN